MSSDTAILGACIASRKAWEKVYDHIDAGDLSPPVGFWWTILAEAYKRDSAAGSMDKATLRSLGESRIPSPKQADTLLGVLDMDVPASPINVVTVVLELKRKNLVAEFAGAAMGGEQKKANKLLEALNSIWKADNLDEHRAEWKDSLPAAELFGSSGTASRIPFGPPSLNAKLDGGVFPGCHVVVFGRTEIGKSTFVVDAVARLLKRGKRVLYVGNEDEINRLKIRLICRTLRVKPAEAEARKEEIAVAFHQYEQLLLMTQLYNGTVDSIRERVIQFKPDVVVIDQFRNLAGPEDGQTQRMEANAIKLRALLLEFGLVGISVAQANDRSERHGQEPPVWLQTGDIDSSRVGLPGQADLIIGLGANSELKSRGQRFVSLCKNKCSAAPGSHEGFVVAFDLEYSRVS